MSWDDYSFAMKYRDIITSLVKRVIDEVRPEPIIGMVYSYNRFSRTAEIVMAGATEKIEARFGQLEQPTKAMTDTLDVNGIGIADGQMVLVTGKPGNYLISRLLNQSPFIDNPKMFNPTWMGGSFFHETHGQRFANSAKIPSAVGNAVGLGTWDNSGVPFSGVGVSFFDLTVRQEFFTGLTKRYHIPLTDATFTWQKVQPSIDTGSSNGIDFDLELQKTSGKVELRIRRTAQGAGNTPGGYQFSLEIIGTGFTPDNSNFNVETAEAAPSVWLDPGMLGRSPGEVVMWAGPTIPPGWSVCDGGGLNTTTNARLFRVIGYEWGGSGSTFNKPDFRDRFPAGAGTAFPFGSTDGLAYGSARSDRQQHLHSHSIAGQDAPNSWGVPTGTANNAARHVDYGGHAHGGGTGNAMGSNSAHPRVGIYFIIKL